MATLLLMAGYLSICGVLYIVVDKCIDAYEEQQEN